MMNISILMEIIPDSIKADILTFNDVRIKSGYTATRIIINRDFKDNERETLKAIPNIISVGTGSFEYAPELKKGTFLIVSNYTLKKMKKDGILKWKRKTNCYICHMKTGGL